MGILKTRINTRSEDFVANAVLFRPGIVFHGHDPFDFSEVYNQLRAADEPFYGSGDELADAVSVLFVDDIAFGAAQFLRDHLPRFLGGDAAEVFRGDDDVDILTDFTVRVDLARIF